MGTVQQRTCSRGCRQRALITVFTVCLVTLTAVTVDAQVAKHRVYYHRYPVDVEIDLEKSSATVQPVSTRGGKSKTLYDYNTHIIAYKDLSRSRCYLERMRGGAREQQALLTLQVQRQRSRSRKEHPRTMYTSDVKLTKRQIWQLAGQRIYEFCHGFPTSLLQEVKPKFLPRNDEKINELPEDEDTFINIQQAEVHLGPIQTRRRRDLQPSTGYAKRYRGQTQSQYLSFGTTDKDGKAEAESRLDGTRAVVTGSNGLGQAQSQSGTGGGCEDCFGYPGEWDKQSQQIALNGRPPFSRPGQVWPEGSGQYPAPGGTSHITNGQYIPGGGQQIPGGRPMTGGQQTPGGHPISGGRGPISGGQQISGRGPISGGQQIPGRGPISGGQQIPGRGPISGGQQIPGGGQQIPGSRPISGDQQIPGGLPISGGQQIPGRGPISGGQQIPGRGPISGGQQIPGRGPISGGQQIPGRGPISGGQQIPGGGQQIPGSRPISGDQQIPGGLPISGGQQIPGGSPISGGQPIPGGGQQLHGRQPISGGQQVPGVYPISGGQQVPGGFPISGSQQIPGGRPISGGQTIPGGGQQIPVHRPISGGQPISGGGSISGGQQITGGRPISSGQQIPTGGPVSGGQQGPDGHPVHIPGGQINGYYIPGHPEIQHPGQNGFITNGKYPYGTTGAGQHALGRGKIPFSGSGTFSVSGTIGNGLHPDSLTYGDNQTPSGHHTGYETSQKYTPHGQVTTTAGQVISGGQPDQYFRPEGYGHGVGTAGGTGYGQGYIENYGSGIPGDLDYGQGSTGTQSGGFSYGQHTTGTQGVGNIGNQGLGGTGTQGFIGTGTQGLDGTGTQGFGGTGSQGQSGIGSQGFGGAGSQGQFFPSSTGSSHGQGLGIGHGYGATDYGQSFTGQGHVPDYNGGVVGQEYGGSRGEGNGGRGQGFGGGNGEQGLGGGGHSQVPGFGRTGGGQGQGYEGSSGQGQIFPESTGGHVFSGGHSGQGLGGGNSGPVLGTGTGVQGLGGGQILGPGDGGQGFRGDSGTTGLQPGGVGAYDQPGQQISGVSQIGDEDAESQAQSSVQQTDGGTQSSASANGRYHTEIAQAQVSGTYSGTGSFSAQAGTSDQNKAAQTQVSGGKEGSMSSAQGRGGQGQSQSQVQLNLDTGSTSSDAQSSGHNYGTNTQVQAGFKGGMADAQANGIGGTSSQAQIGFQPYLDSKQEEHDKQQTPFKGGGSASAQSGSVSGQSQSQISGNFRYGISYTGAAQAGSGTPESIAKARNQPRPPALVGFDQNNGTIDNFTGFTPFKPTSVNDRHGESMQGSESKQSMSSNTNNENKVATNNQDNINKISRSDSPTISHSYDSRTTIHNVEQPSQTTLSEEDDDDDYIDYEDDYTTSIPDNSEEINTRSGSQSVTIGQSGPSQSQSIQLGPLEDIGVHVIQDSDGDLKEGMILHPGQAVPGTPGYKIPQGFRGRVTSVANGLNTAAHGGINGHSQAQSVTLTPGGGGKIVYSAPSTPNYSYKNVHSSRQLNFAPVKNSINLKNGNYGKPDSFVTVTKSVTGELSGKPNSQGDYTGKQFSHTYYTKSSTCGYFTFSCNIVYGTNGRTKICRPKTPTNPDGTPMQC